MGHRIIVAPEGGYVVVDHTLTPVTKVSRSRDAAEALLHAIEARNGAKKRHCITCGRGMTSSHAGHRMCGGCRNHASDAVGEYSLGRR